MVMAEDVPALQAMKPGGKEHPIDKILHDGEKVTLGGTTLVAHLTAGHTSGCTTWTTTAQEGGRTYNVVFSCSLRSPATLTPAIVGEMNRSFKLVRTLPCDVQVGDHPAQYNMHEKYAKLQKGGPNPFSTRPAATSRRTSRKPCSGRSLRSSRAPRAPAGC
jgi:metallo-beta-lactamase class B